MNTAKSRAGMSTLKILLAVVSIVAVSTGGYFVYLHYSAPRNFAKLLPQETLLYLRVQELGTLKDRFVQDKHLKNAEPVQKDLEKWYNDLIDSMTAQAVDKTTGKVDENYSLGLKKETLDGFIKDIRSFHVAVFLQEEEVPYRNGKKKKVNMPKHVMFLEMGSSSSIDLAIGEMGKRVVEETDQEIKYYKFTAPMQLRKMAACVIEGNVLVLGEREPLLKVLKAQREGIDKSLADSVKFTKATDEMGRDGDLFLYVDLVQIQAMAKQQMRVAITEISDLPEDMPEEYKKEIIKENKERQKRQQAQFEQQWKLFDFLDCIAGNIGVDGTLSLRLYSVEGKSLPDFLARASRKKEFLERMPANTCLAYDFGYDGAKKTRKSFADWLEKEVPDEMIPREAKVFTENLDQLEDEVVVIGKDFWAAAIPVDKELAMCAVAPSDKAGWGMAVFFDYEDAGQVEKLRKKLFEEGTRYDLPWEKTTYEGLEIHYLDMGKMMQGKIPEEYKDMAQLKLGYAVSDELFMIGTLETLKFIHKPEGETLADKISFEGVDEKNAFQFVIRPSIVLQELCKIKGIGESIKPFAEQLPDDANYSVTMSLEKQHATLRSNIPFTSLITWLGFEVPKQISHSMMRPSASIKVKKRATIEVEKRAITPISPITPKRPECQPVPNIEVENIPPIPKRPDFQPVPDKDN